MEGLGRLFDIGICAVPVDLNTADGFTGKRLAMSVADSVTIVAVVGVAASGTDDLTFDVLQHTAYTGGTTADLDEIDHFYIKSETALDNDEPWVRVAQSAASEVVVAGATYAALQKLVAIEVNGAMLSDGYTHISVDCTAGNVAQLAAVLYFPHELRYQRKPANLRNLLRPSAANA